MTVETLIRIKLNLNPEITELTIWVYDEGDEGDLEGELYVGSLFDPALYEFSKMQVRSYYVTGTTLQIELCRSNFIDDELVDDYL